MFKTLQATFRPDKDYPARTFKVSMLRRVLEGTIYDNLPNAFHEEKRANGEYVPLRERRPCVRYGLCGIVVEDSIALLFSEGRFPQVECEDEATKEAFAQLIKDIGLNRVMIDAATRGSVGSVVLFLRVLKNRPFVDVMTTEYLTPIWDENAPDTLVQVTEKYKVKGQSLADIGYSIKTEDLTDDFWFQRDFTTAEELYYIPWKVNDDKAKAKKDKSRTVSHNLGFVPVVWVKNLPGGDDIDGLATFPNEAIDTSIEIDYQLSQAGRGLKYSSDPTLLLKEPAVGMNGEIVKGGGNALVVGADGDAKMLEINGTAAQTVIDYVKFLRHVALEKMHGNRTDADKMSAATSGRAMELMNQSLIWLADKLRISYGEGAMLDLLKMMQKAHAKMKLVNKDGKPYALNDKAQITLRWSSWYEPTAEDHQQMATTLKSHIDAGVLSQETATRTIASDFDVEDVKSERALIDAERKTAMENAVAEAQATAQPVP